MEASKPQDKQRSTEWFILIVHVTPNSNVCTMLSLWRCAIYQPWRPSGNNTTREHLRCCILKFKPPDSMGTQSCRYQLRRLPLTRHGPSSELKKLPKSKPKHFGFWCQTFIQVILSFLMVLIHPQSMQSVGKIFPVSHELDSFCVHYMQCPSMWLPVSTGHPTQDLHTP